MENMKNIKIMGLREVVWAIVEVEASERCEFRGESALRRGLEFAM
jgi:hypothetical protein